MGSTFGKLLKISIFGESHGEAVGVTIDGFPAGICVDSDFIAHEMSRRAPGTTPLSTARHEADTPKILSGIRDGMTTGAPICVIIENSNVKPSDYTDISNTPRPGHADFSAYVRYSGFSDMSGGGHFSGRLTAPLVFAGALSKLALAQHGISIISHLLQVGDAFDDMFPPDGPTSDDVSILSDAIYPIINSIARESMLNQIESAKACGDSIGGVIECACLGVYAGLGSPIFDAVESRIAAMQFSIPAVRGVEFGSGFGSAFMRGSEANDEFYVSGGDIKTHTNNHGGVLGGISTGMPISFRVAFKPTPSIAKKQKTVDLHELHDCEIEIKGRHDPCVALRAVPVVEAGAAIVLLDLLMEAKGYENIR